MNASEVRARRRALGMTQAQFAAEIGLSRDFIGQMERGVADVRPRTAARIRELRPAIAREPTTKDPMERLIEQALIDAGIRYETDQGGGTAHRLDFDLPDYDVAIEVKRMHTPRVAEQMARAPNVIVAQGEGAVRFFGRGDQSRRLPEYDCAGHMTRDQLRRLIIAACLVGAIVLFASGMPGFEG